MAEEKLGKFKVGDARKAPVAPSKTRAEQDSKKSQSEAYSLGFSRIEAILETEDAATISASLSQIHSDLAKLNDGAKSSNKDKAAASRAMTAVERTVDLLDYLFQTKAALQSSAQGKAK